MKKEKTVSNRMDQDQKKMEQDKAIWNRMRDNGTEWNRMEQEGTG